MCLHRVRWTTITFHDAQVRLPTKTRGTTTSVCEAQGHLASDEHVQFFLAQVAYKKGEGINALREIPPSVYRRGLPWCVGVDDSMGTTEGRLSIPREQSEGREWALFVRYSPVLCLPAPSCTNGLMWFSRFGGARIDGVAMFSRWPDRAGLVAMSRRT